MVVLERCLTYTVTNSWFHCMYGLTVMTELINSLPSSFQFSNPCIDVVYCWSKHGCQGKYVGYMDSAECCAYTKNMGSFAYGFQPCENW